MVEIRYVYPDRTHATRNETMRRTDPISGYSYNTRGSGRAKWIILLLLLLLVIVAAIFLLVPGDEDEPEYPPVTPPVTPPDIPPSPPEGGGLVIDQNAGEYVEPTVTPVVQGVAIPGRTSLTIPANTQTVTVDFYNPEANEGLYYLTYKLSLANGEVLYESNAIPPGKHIQSITLSRPLSAGEYDAVIHVQPYRISDETPTNNANMKTKLIVK